MGPGSEKRFQERNEEVSIILDDLTLVLYPLPASPFSVLNIQSRDSVLACELLL